MNTFLSEADFAKLENKVMTANQRWRARLRGEAVPLRARRWTLEEKTLIRHTYNTLKRGDGQMAKLSASINATADQIQACAAKLGLTNSHRALGQEMRNNLARKQVARLRTAPQSFEQVRGVGKSTAGHRADLDGRYFRSQWEANYARFLTFHHIRWEYESKTFWFEKIRRGVRSYTPDFYLPDEDRYHEVKGWMDKRSATKLKRMKKYYPNVVMIVVGREFFKAANKQGLCRLIPGWECQHKKHNGTAVYRATPD